MQEKIMVPEEEAVSAFSVYSGKVSPSRSKKRKMKLKQRKSLDLSLNKMEKIEIIRKKKEKKEKILKTKPNSSEPQSDLKDLSKEKFQKKQMDADATPVVKKKAKKFPLPGSGAKLSKIPTAKSDRMNSRKKNVASNSNGDAGTGLGSSSNTDLVDKDDDGAEGDSTVCKEQIPDSVIVKPNNKKPDSKKIKKLQFVEPVLHTKVGGFKRAIVSTPKVNRKAEKRRKAEGSLLDESSSNVLLNVDQFLEEKKKMEFVLSSSDNSAKEKTAVLKLAEQAKAEIMKQGSSEASGKVALEKILSPHSLDSFLREYWEKKPLHIIGKRRNKFSPLISTEMIDSVLRDNTVLFGKHLDVTVYNEGKRETHNMEGRAQAHVVWDFYSNGCSVRLLNPQYFMNTVHTLNSSLQEYFGCFVGANVYLTPPNSQGFAPHYDDIEAFILQVEGSKYWRIYPPISKDGYLPRFSSRNLSEDEIGEPMMEIKLSAGDVLYFPRGFIHQGRTEEEHSLHITLSVYQKTAWCDLLEKLLPLTLKNAAKQDVEFRKGLPLGYLKSGGLAYKEAPTRKQIVSKLKALVSRLNDYLETDEALDQMGLSFVQDALPPVLNSCEAACSVTGGGLRMKKDGLLTNQIEFSLNTSVRWIRAYCYRILEEDVMVEDGSIEHQVRIYHTLDNSREYHKEEPQYVIIPPSMVPAVIYLASAYPKFTKISDLPGSNDDEKITLVGDLWDHGLLMTESPLEVVNEGEVQKEPNHELTTAEMEVVAELEEPGLSDNDDENVIDDVEDADSDSDESTQSSGSLETELNPFSDWQKENGDERAADDLE